MSNSSQKIAFHTLGCKLNFSESSTIARDFIDKGFSIVKDYENAEIHIINTCSVTDKADRKAKKIINKIIKSSYNPYITVIGCYAQLKPNEIAQIDGVNLVIGDQQKLNVANHILKNYNSKSNKIMHSPISDSITFKSSFSMNDRTRSYLKIQDGCDYPCTYCTIPEARGRSRSDSIDNIINNLEILNQNKISEVVLTGVNIGDYKQNNTTDFLNLIQNINNANLINRIRISSIEPNLLTKEIIELIANSNSFLPHFHIPLQSGSNKILKLMKRKYSLNMYNAKVKMIKEKMPHACIGADVIVGFPGETDADFMQTCQFIEKLNINYLHIFSYSDRSNTSASKMKNKISKSQKTLRSQYLRTISNKKRINFYDKHLFSIRKVLFESINDKKCLVGFSDNYIRVIAKGDSSMLNKIFNVKLLEIQGDKVFGEIY